MINNGDPYEQPQDGRLVRVAEWLSSASTFAGALLLTLGSIGLAFGTDVPALFYGGALLSLSGSVWAGIKVNDIVELQKEHQRATDEARRRANSILGVLDATLHALMDALPGVDFGEARISVYRHRPHEFVLLARVSRSKDLERTGRQRYPDDQGVIGKSWDKGSFVANGLPRDRDEWVRACVDQYGIDEEAARGIAMQSCSLVGQRLDSPSATKEELGVIILESTKARGVGGKTIDDLLSTAMYQLLQRMLSEVIASIDQSDVEHFRNHRTS